MSGTVYGRIADGRPVDDDMIEQLADEAERGFDPEQLRGRRRRPGRPSLGAAAKAVESVRLDPAMHADVAERAARDGVSVSEVIRRALGEYLEAG